MKVLVVTTSMGTKWEAYSQVLIKEKVPEWSIKLVNGRRNWSPTAFIENIINEDVDYVFHIDEDCFVESRDALIELVEILELDPKLVAAGTPDGGSYYRNNNPAALNLYFVLFRMNALRNAWCNNNWQKQKFKSIYANGVITQFPDLEISRISWNEKEPYYPLFWSLLNAGGQFLYLAEEVNSKRWSTHVIAPSGKPIAEHLWYLRQWFSTSIMPGHDCSNISRYKSFETDLLLRAESRISFYLNYILMRCKCLIRNIFT